MVSRSRGRARVLRAALQEQHTERLALCHHGYAQGVGWRRLAQMPAQRPGVGTLNQMRLSSPERPAVAGSEDELSRHGIAPNSNGLEVARTIEHTQRAGVIGEQLSGGLANDSVGFLGSDTGMEQIDHLVNQGDLAGVLF